MYRKLLKMYYALFLFMFVLNHSLKKNISFLFFTFLLLLQLKQLFTSYPEHLSNDSIASPNQYVTANSNSAAMSMSFYQDSSFTTLLPQYPVHVSVGDTVYVKVTSVLPDPAYKLVVSSCYAVPDINAPDHARFYLIKDG